MPEYFAHESAYIDEDVRIGSGTRIWHFCHVMPGAKIGRDCTLGQNTFVGRGVMIGDRCKIQNNVSVYEGVTLEDEVFCGPSCVFTNVSNPRVSYPNEGPYEKTLVRSGASIGANATIICGITLGRHAFIGAASVVTADVPDYALVYGVPARLQGWMCECGERLHFEGTEGHCPSCGRDFLLSSPTSVREKTS